MTPSKAEAAPGSRLRDLWSGMTSRRVSVLICAGLLILLALRLAASAWLLREHEIEEWRLKLDNLTTVLGENVAQTMGSTYLMLDTLTGLVHGGDVDQLGSLAVYRIMRDQVSMLPQVSSAAILDANGNIVNSSRSYPAPPLNLADRDYFRHHRAHPAGTPFLSAPVRNKTDGRWTFYVSQRLDDNRGRFSGVVVVGVSCDFLAEFFHRASLGERATIALYGNGSALLAGWPQAPDNIGKRALHMVAVRAVRDYPLLLEAGISKDTLLAGWWTSIRLLGVAALVNAAAILLALRLVTKLLKRRQREIDEALALKADAEAVSASTSRVLAAMRDKIRALDQGGAELAGIVDKAVEFADLERGRTMVRIAPFDPTELLAQTIAAHLPRASRKGLALRCHVSAPPGLVEGDPVHVRRVLDHLIDNAIAHTDAGGIDVSFSIRPAAGRWLMRYAVRDSGPGFDAQAGDFPPQGDGLGLAICKRLVRLMGGELAYTAAGGATVSVELPTRFMDAPPLAAGSKRALVVDDTAMNRQLARILLAKRGWQVDEAHDGAQALDAYARQRYAMVLMDCMMPGMDGYEATRRLRAWEASQGLPRTPVIALTANAADGERERCLAAGADDYLAKPFTAAGFAESIGRWSQVDV